MKKIVRLTESDLVKLVKRVISEQQYSPIESKLDDEEKANQLIKKILPQKGYKRFFNLPDAGKSAEFCNKPKMDDCSAYGKGNKILLVGLKGYCYLNTIPQGQTKNGPFTYDEILKYL